jgi:hypothetical protein
MRRAAGGGLGEGEQGVEGVGLVGFAAAVAAGLAEDGVDDRVQGGVDDRAGLWGSGGDQGPGAVRVGEPAQRPAPVQPGVGGGRVRVGRGPHPGALLAQLRQRCGAGQFEESLLSSRVGSGRVAHGGGLRR